MSQFVSEIGDSEFQAEVLDSDIPVMVDFWAPWCGPCIALAPTVDELAKEYNGKVKFVKVNVDYNRENAAKYQISAIPTVIFIKNGEVQDQVRGAVSKQELLAVIKKLI